MKAFYDKKINAVKFFCSFMLPTLGNSKSGALEMHKAVNGRLCSNVHIYLSLI